LAFRCGILDFNSLFYSDHHPLFLNIDILRLLGYPVQGNVKFLERDLKLNDNMLVEVYQSSLFQQLLNHNAAARLDSLYLVNASAWLISHENKFNQIDRDVARDMTCAANACLRKSYKKHKWTEEYTHGIYSIRYWCLRRKMLDKNNTFNDSIQTLQFMG
jgi:hypothetical protein